MFKKNKAVHEAPLVEFLEPRILLSADLPGLDLPGVDSDDSLNTDADALLACAGEALLTASESSDDVAADAAADESETGPDDPAEVAASSIELAEETSRELVIVDSSIPDYELLLAGLPGASAENTDLDVVLLDPQRDGIEQVSALLATKTDLNAIHLISHGGAGEIRIGTGSIDLAALRQQADSVRAWGDALHANGDILIYGCNLTAHDSGEVLVDVLAELTGADVAASDDLTGHAESGGDWDLEYRAGDIETTIAVTENTQLMWNGVLDIATGLVGHWTLDSDGSDSSGNAHDGTLGGNAMIDTDTGTNKVGPGKITLDGADDYLDLSTHAAALGTLSQGTIAGWINTSDTTNTQAIFGIADHGDDFSFATFGVWKGRLFFDVAENDGFGPDSFSLSVSTDAIVADGDWHHVVLTIDGTGNAFYIDGVKVAVGALNYSVGNTGSTAFLDTVNDVDAVQIGVTGESGTYVYDFNGLIDDVRVYDRALTESDIAELSGAPSDLSSGIELNNDGGNDTYLATSDGGAIIGGLSTFTMEFQFAIDQITEFNPLISYATLAQQNAFLLMLVDDGTLSVLLNGVPSLSLSGMDYRDLMNGELHSLGFSWDSANGDWSLFVDGERLESGTGFHTGESLAGTPGDGTIVFGQEQDAREGDFQVGQQFVGTYYDVRIWNDVRSEAEVALTHQQKLDSGNLPSGLIANWQMDGFNGSNEVVDVVGGNNLRIGHAPEPGFIASTPVDDLHVDEGATNGTRVGYIMPSTSQASEDLVSDGRFLDAPEPGSADGDTYHADGSDAGSSFGAWTVTNGSVDLKPLSNATSRTDGRVVDLDGASGGGAIAQALSTVVGQQYTVLFELGGDFSNGDAIKDLRVSAAGSSQDFQATEPPNWSYGDGNQFDQRSFTFTADSTSTTLEFRSLESGSSWWGPMLADVRVMAAPGAVNTVLSGDPALSYDAGTGKFYKTVTVVDSWAGANATAQAALLNGVGGNLVSIHSSYENDLVQGFAQAAGGDIWIGATDQTTEGEFFWQDNDGDGSKFWTGGGSGSAVGYANWSASGPRTPGTGEDFVRMSASTGVWDDFGEGVSRRFVIEWDASEVLGSHTFSLTGDAGGRFAIDANTGEVTVTDGSLLDHEAAASHDVRVRVTDAGGMIYDEVMTIAVNDANDPPVNAVPGAQRTDLDTDLVFFSGNGNAITVSDPESSANPVEITLSVDHGTLRLDVPALVASGGELQPNTFESGAQADADVAVAPDGSSIMVWDSSTQDGSNYGVYGQLYDADGNKIGSEFLVNTQTVEAQADPAVAVDANGDFVVVWASFEQDGTSSWGIYGQRYAADGSTIDSEFRVNATAAGQQTEPDVVMHSNGDFVVTWTGDGPGDAGGVFFQRYDSSGAAQGGEILVNTTTAQTQNEAVVAMDGGGNFTVVWTSATQDGDSAGIFGQRFDASGNPIGSEFQVNSYTTGVQDMPAIAAAANGEFVVVWVSTGQDGSGEGIYAQQFNADGTTKGTEFLVDTMTTDNQTDPTVAMDGTGFLVAWTTDAGGYTDVQAREFDADGNPRGNDFRVNTTETFYQWYPSAATNGNGDYLVAWNGYGAVDTSGIATQRYEWPTDLTIVAGDSGGVSSITFSGSIADVNTALEGLVYTPDTGYTGPDTLTITTVDGELNALAIDVDLKGAYEFSSASPAADSSPSGTNGGTLNGNASIVSDGARGDVLSLDGSGDYVQVSGLVATSQQLTLAGWVYLDPAAGTGEVFDLGYDVSLRLDAVDGVQGAYWDGSSILETNSGQMLAGTGWHHVAYSVDTVANTQVLYIDGQTVATTIHANSIVYAGGDGNTYIGATQGGSNYFDGLIDDARIYERVLSAAEVATLAASPGGLSDTDTVDITVSADPVITSNGGGDAANINVTENATAVTTVTVNDPDGGAPVYTLISGADQSKFAINSASGELTFQSAPDFENPTDSNLDNVYEVVVLVSDGAGGTDTQVITVTVTNANDNPPLSNADAYSVDEDGSLTVAWWDSDWSHRRELTFDNLAQSETLTDFPVLVVLNAGNIDYALTNDDGSDLRFFAADGTPLAYQIETWNESGDSSVWVRVPQITGSSDTDSVWMYYGNNAASPQRGAEAVWDSNFAGVWHLNEEQAGTGNGGVYQDATGNGNDGVDRVAATGQEGQVPDGQAFAANDWIEIDHDPSLDLKDSMTISFWIKQESASGTFNRVVEKGLWGYQDSYYFGGGDGTNDLTFYLNNQLVIETPNDTLSVGGWHHAAVSYTSNVDGTGGTARLYLDGVEIATGDYTKGVVIPGNTGRLAIGHHESDYDFDGSIDEVQISNIDRSADWIAAHYQATRNQFGSEFVKFGTVENAPVIDGVITNDTDADNDLLTASIVSGPSNAAAFTFDNDGTFSYAPDADFNGTDSFTYKVNDGSVDGNTQTVTITVDPVNDAPVARPDGVHLAFDGDDIVQVADHTSLQMADRVTMEAWIKPTGLGSGSQLILNKEGEYELGIIADTGEVLFAIADSLDTWAWHYTGQSVTLGEWSHVAVSYDGGAGEANTYINGQLVDTHVQSGTIGDVYPTFNDLIIGGRGNDADERFEGRIDEVRVWSTARTAGELQATLNGPLNGSEPGLAGNWRLDEATGSLVIDQSPFNNNGVLGSGGQSPTYQGYITAEDTPLVVSAGTGVLANDSDADGDGLTVNTTPVSTVTDGILVLNADGRFTYTPDANFSGTDRFTYEVSDGNGGTDTATVTIAVSSVNDQPTTTGLADVTVDEDAPNSVIDLHAAFDDVEDADTDLVYSIESNTNTALFSSTDITGGNLTLDYAPNQHGTADITVRATDMDGLWGESTVTVTVDSINDDPSNIGSLPTDVTVIEDTPGYIDLSDIDFEDVDAGSNLIQVTLSTSNGGVLTASSDFDVIVSGSGFSTMTLRGGVADLNSFFSSAFRFQYSNPTTHLAGDDADTIQITVNDLGNSGDGGGVDVDFGALNVDITPVNDAPELTAGTVTDLTVAEDSGLTALGLGSVAYSPGGGADESTQTLSYEVTVIPSSSNGEVFLADGTTKVSTGAYSLDDIRGMQFKPAANWHGTTAFEFRVEDSGGTPNGGSDRTSQFMWITVDSADDAPVADLNGTNDGGTGYAVTFTEDGGAVLVSDADAMIEDVDSTQLESLSINVWNVLDGASEQLTIAGYTFTYGSSDVVTRTVGGTLFEIDFDGSGFSIAKNLGGLFPVADLQLLIRGITYENLSQDPTAGDRTVEFVITDDTGVTGPASNSTVTVNPQNDQPTTTGIGDVTVDEDDPDTAIDLYAAFADAEDADADMSYTIESNTNSGLFTSTSIVGGNLTLDYAPNQHGIADITVRATDSGGLWVESTFTVTVNPLNDQPTTTGIGDVTIDEDDPNTVIDLYAAFDDVEDADADLVYSIESNTNASLFTSTGIAGGNLTLDYAPNQHGSADITVRATDSGGLWVESTFTVTVNPINDQPTTSGIGDVTVDEDDPNTIIDLYAAFDDVEDVDADLVYSIQGNTNAGLFISTSIAGGNLTLDYAPNQHGSANITVRATDSGGLWVESTFTVTVDPVEDLPVAGDDSYTTAEDTAITAVLGTNDLLQNDSDDDGDPLTVTTTPVVNVTDGTLVLNANGTFTYTPDANFTGSDSFTYEIDDGKGNTDQATVTITVTGANDTPTTSGIANVTVDEDAANTVIDLYAAFDDAEDADADLVYSIESNTNAGLFTSTTIISGNLTLDYASNQHGSANITVRATDTGSLWVEETFTVTVNAVEDLPVAGDDSYTTTEDTAITAVLGTNDLLQNDSDDDGDPLAVNTIPVVDVSNGTLVLNANGTFTYTPDANFSGSDSFTYEIDDGKGNTAQAVVGITVTGANDTPTTSGIADVTVDEDDPNTVIDLYAAFDDAEDLDPALSYTIQSNTNTGLFTSTSIASGNLTLDYAPNQHGIADITVRATDSSGLWVDETFRVTVNSVEDLPVAANDTYMVAEDTPLTTVLGTNDLLQNDSDDDGDPLTVNTTPLANVTDGTLVLNANGTFTYTPNANFTGSDGFLYEIDDGKGNTNFAFVSITVSGANDTPTTSGIPTVTVNENAPNSVIDLYAAFDDTEDADTALSYTIQSNTNPALFASTTIAGGSLTLDYASNQYGSADITIRATDSGGLWVESTVTVTVNSVEGLPVAGNDSYSTTEGHPITTVLGSNDLLQNDSDSDGDPLTVNTTPVADVSNGTLILNADGTFTYTPDANFSGSDSFTYEIDDGKGNTAQAVVSISVGAVNSPPSTALVTLAPMSEDGGARRITSAELLGQARDPDGDPLRVSNLRLIEGSGSLESDGTGRWLYTPAADDDTQARFSYVISDGGYAVVGGAVLDILPVDDPATISGDDSALVQEDVDPDAGGELSASGRLVIVDPDDEDTRFEPGTVFGSDGRLEMTSDGDWTYRVSNDLPAVQQLDEGEQRSEAFPVTATDGTVHLIVITLQGSEDQAVISAVSSGGVAEDTRLNAGGTLAISDVDASDQGVAFPDQTAPGDQGYGHFVLSDGSWHYTLDNAHAAVQALNTGERLEDSYTFVASDGSAQQVVVRIQGLDEPPVVEIDNDTTVSQPGGPVLGQPVPPVEAGPPGEVVAREGTSPDEPLPAEALDEPLPVKASDEASPAEAPAEPVFTDPGVGSGRFEAREQGPQRLIPDETLLEVLRAREDGSTKPIVVAKPSVSSLEALTIRSLALPAVQPVEPMLAAGEHSERFWNDVNQMVQDFEASNQAEEKKLKLSVEAAAGVGITLTAGFVSWALRAGSLVASFLAAMPTWRHLDPLPILAADEQKQGGELEADENEQEGGEPGATETNDEYVDGMFGR